MAKLKGKSLKKALNKQLTAQHEQKRRTAYEERQKQLEKSKGQAKQKSKPAAQKAKSKPSYQPYHDGQRILLVGEGNFSFALAFAKKFPNSAKNSIATAYDSEEEAKRKYSDCEGNVKQLGELGMQVLYGVDAQNLEKAKVLKKCAGREDLRFDHVAFYFPHVGLGEKDESRNVKLNQILILRFLRSVKPLLKENSTIPQLGDNAILQDMEEEMNSDPESLNGEMVNDPTKVSSGTILITLFTSKPYNLWSLPSLAKTPDVAAALLPFPDSQQVQPKYKVERSFAFVQKEWPGYDHVRTIGERKGQESLLDRTHSEARTWQLVPAPEVDYEEYE